MKNIKLIAFCFIFLAFGSNCLAAETTRIASIKDINGKVEVSLSKGKWIPAEKGMQLNPGDLIRTKTNSFAIIKINGAGETALVELKEKSQLNLSKMLINKEENYQQTLLDLSLGKILIKAQKLHADKSRFEVKTPTSIVAVRGTTFSVAVEAIE